MLTEKRCIGTIGLVPMNDISYVNGAPDDVVELCPDDATDGLDVSERELHLVRDGDLVNIRSLASHAELT